MAQKERWEKDSLGELSVPAEALYGIQTVRASRNFPISGLQADVEFLEAVMYIKKAAASVNSELGRLDGIKAEAIGQACDEVIAGKFHDQFIVDVFQMGAGTSFHMNCNEVLANRAEELLGGEKGAYTIVNPHDHVNMGQSTNDVFPTAMRLSAGFLLARGFLVSLKKLESYFQTKAEEFNRIIKSGRTHLQDAAPVTLGQEFQAYSVSLTKDRSQLERTVNSIYELGIGGSAVGTGLNTDPGYGPAMISRLRDMTGFDLREAEDKIEAMQSMRPLTEVSAALRNLALDLNRIANDLRLLSSGPRTGLREIRLPAVAPGSSIMPGKINPSLLEMLNMVCYQVIGCDNVICAAAQAGQLELNVMMPVIAFNLNFMLKILGNAIHVVGEKCIAGITADPQQCREYAEKSIGLAAVLSSKIGYQAAAEIAQEAVQKDKSLVDIVLEKKLFTRKEIKELLDPTGMTKPRSRPQNK